MIDRLFPMRNAAALVGGGAFALLAAAFAFQHLGGLDPCVLCVWQRWPHVALVLLCGGAAALSLGLRPALILGGVIAMVGAGLAGFHVGVEYGWWRGLEGCSAPDFLSLDSAQAREMMLNTDVIRCDEVAWSLLGLSMAGWNGLISLAIAGFCGLAALRGRV